jgi:hypothetical protein
MHPPEKATPESPAATPSVDDVVRRATDARFGRKLIVNLIRASLVEAIVALAMPDWTWSTGYDPYDFIHADATRMEIKQSAARQSWVTEGAAPSKCLFDIAAREGFREGAVWVDKPGRNADLYVLAHHGVEDIAVADHRDSQPMDLLRRADVRSSAGQDHFDRTRQGDGDRGRFPPSPRAG